MVLMIPSRVFDVSIKPGAIQIDGSAQSCLYYGIEHST